MTHTYEIRVEEQIGEEWSEWFGRLAIHHDEQSTLLVGPVADQAALYGLLNKLRDFGLNLISLRRIEDADSDQPPSIAHNPYRFRSHCPLR